MRVLVCGSRSWKDETVVRDTLDTLDVTVLIQGDCYGPDLFSKKWATDRGIPIESYPAAWRAYGRSAGFRRNKQMIEEGKPDIVFAFWDGVSAGTYSTLSLAKKAGIKAVAICSCGREYDFERPDTHAAAHHQ